MERETLDVDVLIVGGGPAGLSAALRLAQLQTRDGGEPLSIAVLEKARESGAHLLSGAVLDPRALAELLPDYRAAGAPIESDVTEDHVYVLNAGGKLQLPLTPPPLRNHGNLIISLSRFGKWLAERAEAAGIDLFAGFSGVEILFDGDRVIGVRTGDRGVGRDGAHKSGFEPGVDIHARVTILCDGVRGNLTKQLLARLPLAEGRQPEQYAIGIKELWEVPPDRIAAGTVMHTLGYPLRLEEFGGGFLYAMPGGRISLGLVVGLDYRDPLFDPYEAFQRFKLHPLIADLLHSGQRIKYGAKALPEGGWHTIPRCWADGVLIAGDAGGFLNSFRLKGIHLAMKSGMLAAETAFEVIRAEAAGQPASLQKYEQAINASWIRDELYPVRNVHQAFEGGLPAGLAFSAFALATGGRWPDTIEGHPGYTRMRTLAEYDGSARGPIVASNAIRPDRVLTFDKVTSVHYSGTRHEEDQPVHLLVQTDVCYSRCGEEYGHPCQRFCPANVYEMVRDATGAKRLQINASNCVHCKTCDIMDPYQVITWVPPEGGGGPQYDGL